MGFLSSIFGSSSSEKQTQESSLSKSDLPSGDRSRDSELVTIMKAKNLDMTSSSIKLTTQDTSRHISVARGNMIESIQEAVENVKNREKQALSHVNGQEEKRLEMEVHAAEDDSKKVINADIDQKEKLIVSSTVLLEASELLAKHINQIYRLKQELGDRSDTEVREDMGQLWMEVDRICEMNIPAYNYIHEHAQDEQELVSVTVNSANLFRNCVKVFSALTRDAGKELQRKQVHQNSQAEFISGDQTIFQEYFDT